MARWLACFALLLAVAALGSGSANAQAFLGGDDDEPLQIFADSGIEWQREARIYIARGNARAVKGKTAIRADELRAYYTGSGEGTGDIYRVEAIGNVVITSPDGTAFGEHAIYEVTTQVMMMKGGDLKLVTATDVVTAKESLEYWQGKNLAVARGKAEVLNTNKEDGKRSKIRANVMTASFTDNAAGNREMDVLDAYDEVEIITQCEYIKADRGRYLVKDQLATITGNVKITRGSNQLNGDEAEVNLATGISTLKGDQVQGLLLPSKKQEKDKNLPPGCE